MRLKSSHVISTTSDFKTQSDMDAPDKIYIHRKDNPLEITWSETEEKGCTNTEYIRKDIVDDMLKTAEDHAYLAGADWQKEQMLKEAFSFYEIIKVVPPGPERDRVRLIVVKED